jgi:hypothetical protein
MQLLGNKKANKSEIDEIKKIISQIENEQKP